ncbi:MAG: type II toxin-antitoxin system mRNA interferase toxin, RelE/StbE family [Deltaproteobacteria bacterium]|nr:type II toxin-antitoxin system mRNA interferase toxin, RelE/StbE family [Deltaproteobacteria bacterium]
MNKYRIFETVQFQKDLLRIAKSGHSKMTSKLRDFVYPQLHMHPHFGPNIKKLKDYSPETWRYRIGAWRFFYEIDEEKQIIFMITASHRSNAY